jgi:hypothetical protein
MTRSPRQLGPSLLGVARAGQTLGLNAIPAFGFLAAGWSSGATLVFYWVETLLLTLAVSALILVHRLRTRRAGHWLGFAVRSDADLDPAALPGSGYHGLRDFLAVMIPFSAAHGILVAFLTFQALPELGGGERPTATDLLSGASWAATFVLLGFLLDLLRIGSRPFSWIEATARGVMGRMVVIHLTILFGMVAMAATDAPDGFFAVFAVMKTAMDFARRLPAGAPSEDPPWWLGWLDRVVPPQKGESFLHFWRRTHGEDRRMTVDKERVVPRTPASRSGLPAPGPPRAGSSG